jgi:hypothetical protein
MLLTKAGWSFYDDWPGGPNLSAKGAKVGRRGFDGAGREVIAEDLPPRLLSVRTIDFSFSPFPTHESDLRPIKA